MDKLQKLVETLGHIADNVWAFGLFVLAATVAVAAHFGKDHDLLSFAVGLTTAGATIFSRKRD